MTPTFLTLKGKSLSYTKKSEAEICNNKRYVFVLLFFVHVDITYADSGNIYYLNRI